MEGTAQAEDGVDSRAEPVALKTETKRIDLVSSKRYNKIYTCMYSRTKPCYYSEFVLIYMSALSIHMTKTNVLPASQRFHSLGLLTVVYCWMSLQVCWLAFDSNCPFFTLIFTMNLFSSQVQNEKYL